jgi:uncharacterized repeat protein (TIGR01451 family)
MKKFSILLICFLKLFLITSIHATDPVPYLSILSPSGIVGIYFSDSSDFRAASGWGGNISGNNFIGEAKIPDQGELLCTSDNTDFSGKIAIIKRGTCEFGTKALNAQNQGAAMVLIVNFENNVLTMGAGSVGSQLNIPVFIIRKDIGENIINAINDGQNVVLSIGSMPEGFGLVQGFVRHDLNGNCLADSSEKGLRDFTIQIKDKAGNVSNAKSDDNGFYRRYLSPLFGPYKLSMVPKNNSWNICDPEREITVTVHDTTLLDFVVESNKDCVELHTEITASRLRRCFITDFYVKVCNEGTEIAKQSYVEVGLAKEFGDLYYASLNYTEIGPDLYRFQLGDLQVNDCASIHIMAKLTCDSVVLDQTLCYFAQAFPDTSCQDISTLWSGADIKAEAHCLGNEVEFILKNNGHGNMSSVGKYVIIRDDEMYQSSTYQLSSGHEKIIKVPADGSTWHIEATQESYNPNPSVVSKTIEACSSNGNFTTGYAMMFPLSDEGFAHDEECQIVRGSYDPNEKEGFPLGFGFSNLIKPNTELEYIIRFQNTGTDTAFTVLVEDLLPWGLDPNSIHDVVSSHSYQMDLVASNRLLFRFDNILLVDSFTNEPASHGFVSFKIKQKPNNAFGTFIDNSASIYFDFNAPVLTNFVFHAIGDVIGVVSSKNLENSESKFIYPNPGTFETTFQLESNQYDKAQWNLLNLQGEIICSGNVEKNKIVLPAGLTQSGLFLLAIQSKNAGKMILKLFLN